MPVALDAPPALEPREPVVAPPAGGRHVGGNGDAGAGGRGGGSGRDRRSLPAGVAIAAVVALAVLLTYLGMLTQIWANLAGSQLPGA